MTSRVLALAASAASAAVLAGCGLDVASPDLFVLTRTGEGSSLTMLVNDGGTVKCNGVTHSLSDPQLLTARDLANSLDTDAKNHDSYAASSASVYRYQVKLPDGTLSFPDTAAGRHSELAQTEAFALQVAENTCK